MYLNKAGSVQDVVLDVPDRAALGRDGARNVWQDSEEMHLK